MITRVSDSPVFKRVGDNLEVEVPLTIPEAIRGAIVEVPTLNGSKRLRVPRGTKHGTVQRLRGEGPPQLGGKGRGDIHYRFVIDVPDIAVTGADRGGRQAIGGDERRSPGEAVRPRGTGARLLMATRRIRTTTRVEVSSDRGVFMISVAAELADMHPQTLRMYEARGLIEPKRSPKGTRLYSHQDVERLRRIQEMTAELGMNLAGVERVFELEEELDSMSRKVAALEKRAARAEDRGRAARGAAPRAASRDRPVRARRRARSPRRPPTVQDPSRAPRGLTSDDRPTAVRRPRPARRRGRLAFRW